MPMNELISSGLFGLGLLTVDTPAMVARYNECLTYVGLPKTERTSFQIDRVGWSPELAADFGDEYYNSHGPASPWLFVIMPEQRHAPIYYPYHSFDWQLVEDWFDTNWSQVVELLKQTPVIVDLDQRIDTYRSPEDLLLVSEIISRAYTPCNIMRGARRQKAMVRRMLDDEHAYCDDKLIEKILVSAKEYGDLRGRSLLIRDDHFTDVTDFYSRAFGGVFVLRSQPGERFVLCRSPEETEGHIKLRVADQECIPDLVAAGYVSTDLSWWREHMWRLRIVQESFLVDVLEEHEAELDFWELNPMQQQAVISRYAQNLDIYFEIGRIAKQLEMGEEPKDVPEDIMVHLLHPAEELNASSQLVIWHLLTFLGDGRNIVRYYRHQKSSFVHNYTTEWQAPRRSWARRRIREFYEHASNSHGHV